MCFIHILEEVFIPVPKGGTLVLQVSMKDIFLFCHETHEGEFSRVLYFLKLC